MDAALVVVPGSDRPSRDKELNGLNQKQLPSWHTNKGSWIKDTRQLAQTRKGDSLPGSIHGSKESVASVVNV